MTRTLPLAAPGGAAEAADATHSTPAADAPPVCSYTEWDPLEEVIVGVADGAAVPAFHPTLKATMPRRHWEMFAARGGRPLPADVVAAANRDLDRLVEILEGEAVRVRRPERMDFARPYATPDWSSPGGLYAAMPRDLLLVVGDELIEAPMPWRSRYFEVHAFRPLLREYFDAGARWTAAPRPRLADDLYDAEYEEPAPGEPMRWVITEAEPTFDAADFIRCGHDIFYIRSHVTNASGAAWLQRHLGPRFRLHELPCLDTHPMHIDTTYMPLAPGKLLVNPERVTAVPEIFRAWDVLPAPQPCTRDVSGLYMSGPWLSMNVLMLDERRVVVAAHEDTLIRALRRWGFDPIPCPFENFYRLGGSVHCATLDVRRRGTLQSYF